MHSNAIGNDSMSIKFLKILLPYITHLFNSIITFSVFPTDRKFIKVIPIARITQVSSLRYRAISISPCLSKVFEIIVKNQIRDIEKFSLIDKFEYTGYRRGYCTETAILNVIDNIRRN